MTWGDADSGGDSSAVQSQLKHVQQLQGADSSFVAILDDGSFVSWGGADGGSDPVPFPDQLKAVR